MIKNYINLIKNNWNILYFIVLAISVLFLKFIPLFIGLSLIIFIWLKFDERIFIPFTIVLFLSVTSTINPNIRLVIQVFNTGVLAAICFKIYGLNIKELPKLHPYTKLIAFSFISLMIIATFFSNYKELGITQISRTLLYFLIVYLYFLLFEYYKSYYLLLSSFILVSVIFSFLLIYQFSSLGFSIFTVNDDFLFQFQNIPVHKNTLGIFFTISGILNLLLISYFNQTRKKYLFYFLEFLFFFGLVITNSRSSIGALLVGIIVVYFFINKKMIYYLFSIILFLSTTLLIGPIQKLVGLYFRLDSFSSGRDHIYDAVFAVLPHVWLFGSGPAAAKYEMFKHYPYLLNSPEAIYWQYFLKKMEFGHAHNFFLYYWTDLGILGLVLSILIPVLFIKMGIENIKYFRNVDKKNEYLAIGIFAIGVTYFVRGFFEFGGILTYGFISVDLPFALLYLIHANMNMQVKKGSSINEK